MHEYSIAVCNHRFDKQFVNKKTTWIDFVKSLSNTTRTRESLAEYNAMTKAQQAQIKDIGGFVAGALKDGKRGNNTVLERSMITLDADFAPRNFLELCKEVLHMKSFCVYSTHKHTQQKPRLRLIIPLKAPVSAEMYECVARSIANDIGMEYFDDTTYQASRLMFWPSTSYDGEYFFEYLEGDNLDPHEISKRFDDWRDISFWPRSDRECKLHKRIADKQEDPLAKEGVIGAFCRTYTIQEAIAKFIPDVYIPTTTDNRYTYTQGSTAGGLVIYDEKFAYSNHATDPCSMKTCNAFDLVRTHLYGYLDEEAAPTTRADRLPSVAKMMELIGTDTDTLATIAKERYAEGMSDFEEDFKEFDNEWVIQLETDKKGNFTQTTDNVVKILLHDPKLKNGIGGVDEFRQRIVKFGTLPWWEYNPHAASWSDTDESNLRYYLERVYNITHKGHIDDALVHVHDLHKFHPVRDYLDALVWDGVPRLETIFIDYLGAEDNVYTRDIGRKTFAAAVRRIYHPGCKFDYMATLLGKQGIGKSHFISIMGGEWFSDSITSIQGKEGYEALHGSWLVEMAELTAARKQDVEAVKMFISKREDRYRKAYAKNVSDNPRQCIFFGTTNDDEFLRDYTGNRRFWVVETNAAMMTKDTFTQLEKERDQLWAEAKHYHLQGEKLFLEGESETIAREKQEEHTYRSVRESLINNYLERKLPMGWYDMDIADRILWLSSDEEGVFERTKVCALEVWVECLGGNKNNFPNLDQREVKSVLDSLGWIRTKSHVKVDNEYGKQRSFIKPT